MTQKQVLDILVLVEDGNERDEMAFSDKKKILKIQIDPMNREPYIKLKGLLSLLKVNAKIEEDSHKFYMKDDSSVPYENLIIEYDFDSIYRKLHRGGHKRKKQIHCSYDYIQKQLETKSQEEVAKELGISRATLCRRLREAKNNGSRYF